MQQTKICRYFPNCKRGSSCYYYHPPSSSSTSEPNASSMASAKSKPKPHIPNDNNNVLLSSGLGSGTGSGSVNQNLQCSICYEEPKCYGLLNNCNHLFCFDCVKGWRDAGGEMKRTCPNCRLESLFFIPVSRIAMIKLLQAYSNSPEAGTSEKQSLIKTNLDKKKLVKCKFVNKPPPQSNKCPFGSDCHFSHLDEQGKEIVQRSIPSRPPRRGRHSSHFAESPENFIAEMAESGIDLEELALLFHDMQFDHHHYPHFIDFEHGLDNDDFDDDDYFYDSEDVEDEDDYEEDEEWI